jgi:hypothetical protein
VEKAAAKVEKLGGKVCMGKTSVSQMGYFIFCKQTTMRDPRKLGGFRLGCGSMSKRFGPCRLKGPGEVPRRYFPFRLWKSRK